LHLCVRHVHGRAFVESTAKNEHSFCYISKKLISVIVDRFNGEREEREEKREMTYAEPRAMMHHARSHAMMHHARAGTRCAVMAKTRVSSHISSTLARNPWGVAHRRHHAGTTKASRRQHEGNTQAAASNPASVTNNKSKCPSAPAIGHRFPRAPDRHRSPRRVFPRFPDRHRDSRGVGSHCQHRGGGCTPTRPS